MLAFDPFDATARAEWLKTADRKRKAEVLGRMLKRLGTDKDMPPEDSTEHELYREGPDRAQRGEELARRGTEEGEVNRSFRNEAPAGRPGLLRFRFG